MYDVPFFTALDPDARIKGSRDPLGFEPLWTALGREVVANLTTVTRSIRQFSTLLFGFYFAERASESLGDRTQEFLPAFLRFEQLAAYARFHCCDESVHADIRGIRSVKRNVHDRRRRVCLSAKPQDQILSDQKTYGLYGLFRTAARSSGLLADDGKRLSPDAREHVEQQMSLAGLSATLQEQIAKSIARDTPIDLDNSPVVERVARVLRPELDAAEAQFYGQHLVRGDHLQPPLDVQRRLWGVMEAVNGSPDGFPWEREFSMGELTACLSEANRRGDAELAGKLDRIRRAEQLLGAAALLYGFLLSRDKQAVSSVAQQIAEAVIKLDWLDVGGIGFTRWTERLERLAVSLRCGDYHTACRILIEQNEAVMNDRGGSAWIVIKGDRLDVRLLEQDGERPSGKALRHPWMHTYFLDALKRVGGGAYHGQRGGDEDAA